MESQRHSKIGYIFIKSKLKQIEHIVGQHIEHIVINALKNIISFFARFGKISVSQARRHYLKTLFCKKYIDNYHYKNTKYKTQ